MNYLQVFRIMHTYREPHMRRHKCMHTCSQTQCSHTTHTCIHASMHTCMPACTHACTHAHAHARTHTHTHTYTYTHTHTHTHTHIHTHMHTHTQLTCQRLQSNNCIIRDVFLACNAPGPIHPLPEVSLVQITTYPQLEISLVQCILSLKYPWAEVSSK